MPKRSSVSQCGVSRRAWLTQTAALAAVAVPLANTVLPLVTATLLGACKGNETSRPDYAATEAASGGRTLTVFAAASLREVFTALENEFRRNQPDVEVLFHFAGTQELRAQLEHGANADVFAAADLEHATALERAGLVGGLQVFAENEPVVVVSKEARASLTNFRELRDAKRVVLGAVEVPIGRYSAQILENAEKVWGSDFARQVRSHVVSHELNVKQVLAKVALGEADAGVVYRSDVAAKTADQVGVVTIPREVNVVARYAVARVFGSERPELAKAWVATLFSDGGKATFAAGGFAMPSTSNTSL